MKVRIIKEISELKEMINRLNERIDRILDNRNDSYLYNDDLLKEYLNGDKKND